jgi:hypothetical protein
MRWGESSSTEPFEMNVERLFLQPPLLVVALPPQP